MKPKDIEKAFASALKRIKASSNMRKYGESAADMIKTRTRLGFGVPKPEAKREKLDPLSPDYIETRKAQQSGAESAIKSQVGKSEFAYRKKNQKAKFAAARANAGGLSSQTTPSKSNLTRTGQLLDSISVTSVREGEVTIGPSGGRDDGLTNEELGGYVSKKRPFNNLSDIETKRVTEEIARDLDAAMQEELTK